MPQHHRPSPGSDSPEFAAPESCVSGTLEISSPELLRDTPGRQSCSLVVLPFPRVVPKNR